MSNLMNAIALLLLGSATLNTPWVSPVHACTTLLVGRKATVDGSVLVSHSDDGGGIADPRILQIPSKPWNLTLRDQQSIVRPVMPDLEDFDRYNGDPIGSVEIPRNMTDFGTNSNNSNNTTYSYFDGTYGILNTQQLIVGGESTCSAVFTAQAGPARLNINELSRIALEYTSKARQAIRLMGYLAERYGFYGASDNLEGGAESLLVADPQEGFVLHILPDDTGTSAIWVAQRVPDHHVTVVANMFIIRTVDPDDTHNFMGNFEYMYQVAQRNNLWHPNNSNAPVFDFTRIFSNGEYGHQYYSGRRIWGAYRLVAPSLELASTYDNLLLVSPYPFSIPPDQLLSLQDLFRIHRDYYQDTPFDLSKGLAAGPFGNPDRFTVPSHQRHAIAEKYYHGQQQQQATGVGWERPIALFRTTYTTVSQVHSSHNSKDDGTLWLGVYAPHATCFLPFSTRVTSLPDSITQGHMTKLDKSTAFWTFRYMHSLARLRYNLLAPLIHEAQTKWEGIALELQQSILQQQDDAETVTQLYHNHTAHVLRAWWELADTLVFLYADGYDNQQEFKAPALGYPTEWLERVGYQNGPPPPPPPTSQNHDDNTLPFGVVTTILFLVVVVAVLCKWRNTFQHHYHKNEHKKHHQHHHHTQTPETIRSDSMDSMDRFVPLGDKKNHYGSLQ
ncbi:Peptidase family C69 [Seminavis robusta]|uniref:Peptidase family C69 n=1 Tax=Seminavis robusta TaxID=568900 RepID=A0A9N8HP78_9STRA|nr:Peptidase family C69 [Seminavis robusta]|eukprot:Sro1046_g235010.1 Peptidase family C69 (671) ;mRNA; r:7350-9362